MRKIAILPLEGGQPRENPAPTPSPPSLTFKGNLTGETPIKIVGNHAIWELPLRCPDPARTTNLVTRSANHKAEAAHQTSPSTRFAQILFDFRLDIIASRGSVAEEERMHPLASNQRQRGGSPLTSSGAWKGLAAFATFATTTTWRKFRLPLAPLSPVQLIAAATGWETTVVGEKDYDEGAPEPIAGTAWETQPS